MRSRRSRMALMDKAKKLAEQAQQRGPDEAQEGFNQNASPQQTPDAGAVATTSTAA